MPLKIHPITTNWARGEWSPKLEGRVDLDGYKDSAHEITNWVITVPGGILTRGGWHFVAEVKDSTKEVRLLPLEYSELQNYVLELGDEYMRFFMNCGQVVSGPIPYEIYAPYFESEIWDIRHAKMIDTCILFMGTFRDRN